MIGVFKGGENMLQPNSRIELVDGIRFYEQDILYDDYIYTGSCQIEVDFDYYNNGFGIVLINPNNNKTIAKDNSALLFRLNHKSLEVIYKEGSMQKILGTFSSAYAKTCTDNLKMILQKKDNIYVVSVGGQIICNINSKYSFDDYHIGFYSNKDNTINYINIASTVPYGWIINMDQTNGGYIDFHRDGFELKQCKGQAEIEQIEISLNRGKYYLKYEAIDSDIKPYIMIWDDDKTIDDKKNILNSDGSFNMTANGKVSLKFKGTKGRINKIAITTSKYNDYIRTSPDFEDVREIDSSYLKIDLRDIKYFEFYGSILNVPGNIHEKPDEYSIIKDDKQSYGLYDLDLATNVFYIYRYFEKKLSIYTLLDDVTPYKEINIEGEYITVFKNLNGRIKQFVIMDKDDETINITVENTIKQYVPAVIKSPIVVIDKDEIPLDLSSSYRYYYKNNKKYYWFTNTEREYFKPAHSLKLENRPLDIEGSVIVYGIKHNSKFELERLLEIESEGADTLNACADSYDILYEEELRYLNKETGEIRLEYINEYQWIVVDYLKDKSYCLNYRYHLNSYEVDISIMPDTEVSMIYDNVGRVINNIKFINEVQYINTKISPMHNGYITIGGGSN